MPSDSFAALARVSYNEGSLHGASFRGGMTRGWSGAVVSLEPSSTWGQNAGLEEGRLLRS